MQFNTFVLFTSVIFSNAASLKDGCKQISNSPVYDCGKETDLLKIEDFTLTPDHPVQDQEIFLSGKGIIKKTIDKGAKVKYTITHNGAKIASGDADLCEALESHKAKVQCPIKDQKFDFTEPFKVPSSAVNGSYTYEFVGTQGEDQIFDLYIEYKL